MVNVDKSDFNIMDVYACYPDSVIKKMHIGESRISHKHFYQCSARS